MVKWQLTDYQVKERFTLQINAACVSLRKPLCSMFLGNFALKYYILHVFLNICKVKLTVLLAARHQFPVSCVVSSLPPINQAEERAPSPAVISSCGMCHNSVTKIRRLHSGNRVRQKGLVHAN